MEFSLFQGFVGILRIFTLVFGVIVLGISAYFFDNGGVNEYERVRGVCLIDFDFDLKTGVRDANSLWQLLLAIVIITFIVSLAWVVLFIIGVIVDSGITKTTDMIYHIIGGVLLIIAGIIWIILEFGTGRVRGKVEDPNGKLVDVRSCSKTQGAFVLIAGLLGVVDGCVYLAVAFFVWKSK